MIKKLAAIPVAVLLVTSFAACNTADVTEAELASAREIVNAVIESMETIKSYQFESDMVMDMAGEAEDEAFDANMVMGLDGAIDIENNEMAADITMSAEIPGEEGFDMAMAMYVVDNTAYMKMDYPMLGGPTWMKSELAAGDWEEMSEVTSMTDSYVDLLEAVDVVVVGSEKVKGVDCYVLQVTPDMEQLWDLFGQQAQMVETKMPEIDEALLNDVFRNFSVKQWVSKGTYFLMKAEISMDMEMTAETMGAIGEEGYMVMEVSMTMVVFEHNEPVSIVLPPEAEDAIETGF